MNWRDIGEQEDSDEEAKGVEKRVQFAAGLVA